MSDEVEIVWAYYPSDRSKQGTSEFLPRDVAREKVNSGLARYAPEKRPEPEATAEAEVPAEEVPAGAVTEVATDEPAPATAPRKPRVPAQSEAPKQS